MLVSSIVSRVFRFCRKKLKILTSVIFFLTMAIATMQFRVTQESANQSSIPTPKSSSEWIDLRPNSSEWIDPRLKLYSILVHDHGLPVFFVDPFILLPLLSSRARAWASLDPAVEELYRKYDSVSVLGLPRIIYAGVMTNDTKSLTLPQFLNRIVDVSVTNEYHAKIIQDARPIDFEVEVSSLQDTNEIPTHILISKVGSNYLLVLHILVFHTVKNSTFVWTSAHSPGNPVTQSVTTLLDTPLGNQPTIFDEFGFQPVHVNWTTEHGKTPMTILVPTDLRHFIQQIPNAALIQCNRTFAEIYRSNTRNFSNASQAIADTLNRYALEQTKSLLRHAFMPFWACCGTLLGWFRECGAVRYSQDGDFCTFSSFARESHDLFAELVKLAKSSKKVDTMWTIGLPNVGYEIVIRADVPNTSETFQWDLSFVYPDTAEFNGNTTPSEDEWVTGLHNILNHNYDFYHVPRITKFCSSMLWGLKVQVPCNPLPTIHNDYGVENWMRPIHAGFAYGGQQTQDFYWNKTDYSRVHVKHSNLRDSSSSNLFVQSMPFILKFSISFVGVTLLS